MTVEEFRGQFPQLNEYVYGKPLVYLDNAATSLRPLSVAGRWNEMTLKTNSNIHRAVHYFSELATSAYEDTRKVVADFINAESPSNIVFTSGTTSAINLLAFCYGEAFVREGDEIIVTEEDHHSDIVPWQMLCARKSAVLKVLGIDDDGHLKLDELDSLISDRTRLVCVPHVSNVLGLVNPVREIVRICHSRNCPVLVDGAQGIVHETVDVTDMDVDFYAFSGHKIFAATGTGVLYSKMKWLDRMPPYMGGGDMIDRVGWGGTTYADPPLKFEAGTQNFASVPTLAPALELLASSRTAGISESQRRITDYVGEALCRIEGLKLYGKGNSVCRKLPVFSFTVDGAHHEDLALILDKMGIALRSGQMCAEPLMDRLGVTGVLRASFAPYNTPEEARYFVESLERALKMVRQ